MSNPELVKLYHKAIKALALRARSVKEIRDKLSDSDPSLVEAVIAKLLDQKLLDDTQFAEGYIRYQLSLRPLGERALSFRLHHLGVDQQIIKDALKQVFQGPEVALELARRAIRSKNLSNLEPRKRSDKIARFLAARGFSYSTIRALIDDYLEKE